MITQIKRIVPKYYQDHRLTKILYFGEQLFLSCTKDFTIYLDFENLVHQIMPSDLYREFIEIMSNKLETYTSKFQDYAQFIISSTENEYDKTE